MADLITNLQSIYNTKLQIKEAIGTDSDVFSDYPAYISDLKPSGYTYITANGDYDVSAYSDVNVNVSGGSAVLGGLSVTENGQYSATTYAYDGFDVVNVNVPVPPGYIIPEGTINIDTTGTHDVTAYANAYVDIQVPTYVFGYQDITSNGTTYASTYGLDGFTYVNVNVPTGGGHSGSSIYDAMTIQEALDWIYANLSVGESSTDWFYVKGIIAEASSPITAQYGNWNAWLTDDGTLYMDPGDPTLTDLTKCLYVYRTMFYGHSSTHSTWDPNTDMQIHVGDQVVIYCQLRWHTSTVPRIINGNLFKQGITAQNQLTISQSGTYDVQNYVSAYVDVQGGGGADTLSVTGVWMANAITDGVNTYQMMVSSSGSGINGGLDSYSFGTYVTGNIISIWSQDCLTKYQNGHEIYCEDYDTDYNSEIIATSGTFNWDATNQVANPSGGFSWSEQNFGWNMFRRNYNFTDDLGTTYRISAYDYNTYNSATGNLIINWWEDPNDPGQRYAAIVGTEA